MIRYGARLTILFRGENDAKITARNTATKAESKGRKRNPAKKKKENTKLYSVLALYGGAGSGL